MAAAAEEAIDTIENIPAGSMDTVTVATVVSIDSDKNDDNRREKKRQYSC